VFKSAENVDDSLQIEILLTRLEAQRLADALPVCDERVEMYATALACDIMLKSLKSRAITQERIGEMRREHDGLKLTKGG
jgi:hypothetical protein